MQPSPSALAAAGAAVAVVTLLVVIRWRRRTRVIAAFDIPLIDLGPFMCDEGVVIGQSPTASQKATAAALHECCVSHGFAHITNFGLTRSLEAKAFAASQELFSMPEKTKQACLKRLNPQTNMGYSPFGYEMLNRSRPPDLKEAFNVRNPALHSGEYLDGTPTAFREVSVELWGVLQTAAVRYALACAVALNVEPTFFSSTLTKMDLCTARFLNYPP